MLKAQKGIFGSSPELEEAEFKNFAESGRRMEKAGIAMLGQSQALSLISGESIENINNVGQGLSLVTDPSVFIPFAGKAVGAAAKVAARGLATAAETNKLARGAMTVARVGAKVAQFDPVLATQDALGGALRRMGEKALAREATGAAAKGTFIGGLAKRAAVGVGAAGTADTAGAAGVGAGLTVGAAAFAGRFAGLATGLATG